MDPWFFLAHEHTKPFLDCCTAHSYQLPLWLQPERPSHGRITNEGLESLPRGTNKVLAALKERPVQRRFNYHNDFNFSGAAGQRYRIAGEIFVKGVVD